MARVPEVLQQRILKDEQLTHSIPASAVARGWLGFEPSSQDAIAQTEQRLGISLPPSPRTFCTVTNGWHTVGCFIWEVLPLESIGWIRGLEPHLWQIGVDMEAEFSTHPDEDVREHGYEQGTRVKRSLVISREGDASTWLLDPESVNDSGEWAGGRWSSWNPAMEWISDSFEGLFKDEFYTFLTESEE